MKVIISLLFIFVFVISCSSNQKPVAPRVEDDSLIVDDTVDNNTLSDKKQDTIDNSDNNKDTLIDDSLGSNIKDGTIDFVDGFTIKFTPEAYYIKEGTTQKSRSELINDTVFTNYEFDFTFFIETTFDTIDQNIASENSDSLELQFIINPIQGDFEVTHDFYTDNYLDSEYGDRRNIAFNFKEAGTYQFEWIAVVEEEEIKRDTITVICVSSVYFTGKSKYYNKQENGNGQLFIDLKYHTAVNSADVREYTVEVLSGNTKLFNFKKNLDVDIPHVVTPLLNSNEDYSISKTLIIDKDTITSIDYVNSRTGLLNTIEKPYFWFGEPFGKAQQLNSLANAFLLCSLNIFDKERIDKLYPTDEDKEKAIYDHSIASLVYSNDGNFNSKEQLYKEHYGAYFEYSNKILSSDEFKNPGSRITLDPNSNSLYKNQMSIDFRTDSLSYYGCGSYFTNSNDIHDLSNVGTITIIANGYGKFNACIFLSNGGTLFHDFNLNGEHSIELELEDFKTWDYSYFDNSILENCVGFTIMANEFDNKDTLVSINNCYVYMEYESEYQIISPTQYGVWDVIASDGYESSAPLKPIIYLYPEKPTDVNVKLEINGEFTYTYPTYPQEGWNVKAYPDGKLVESKKGRELYSLFWEGKGDKIPDDETGFVVESSNLESFFEEKLTKLGLNYKEKQEFIVFWAPILKRNKYNFIHFSIEAYKKWAKMEVTPKPDSEIRFLMLYKKVNKNFKVKEQIIVTPKREGFTLVEWGGSIIGSGMIK